MASETVKTSSGEWAKMYRGTDLNPNKVAEIKKGAESYDILGSWNFDDVDTQTGIRENKKIPTDFLGFRHGGLEVDCAFVLYNPGEPKYGGRYEIVGSRNRGPLVILGEISEFAGTSDPREVVMNVMGDIYQKVIDGVSDLELGATLKDVIDKYSREAKKNISPKLGHSLNLN